MLLPMQQLFLCQYLAACATFQFSSVWNQDKLYFEDDALYVQPQCWFENFGNEKACQLFCLEFQPKDDFTTVNKKY